MRNFKNAQRVREYLNRRRFFPWASVDGVNDCHAEIWVKGGRYVTVTWQGKHPSIGRVLDVAYPENAEA